MSAPDDAKKPARETDPDFHWANDPDYDDEGNLDVEWYPDPSWLSEEDPVEESPPDTVRIEG